MKHSFLKINYKKSSHRPKPVHRYIWWLISKYKDTQFIQRHELELIGIPLIIHGLEYHYRNFFKIEQKARHLLMAFEDSIRENGEALYPSLLSNLYPKAFQEIGAYLNVLGRLEKVITSDWINKYVTSQEIFSLIPSILSLIPLRHKYFAHRSFDAPRDSENQILKPNKVLSEKRRGELEYAIQTHLSLGLMGTWRGAKNEKPYLSYEIKIDAKDRHNILKEHSKNPMADIEYFKNEDETGFIHFIPTKHHHQTMLEIKKFFEELFKTNCIEL